MDTEQAAARARFDASIADQLSTKRWAKPRHTLPELAEATGLSEQTVNRYLDGTRHPGLAHFLALCQALGLNTADVIAEAERASASE